MLRAVIFDFNGVIVDDEPVHFELFRRVLGEEGLELTREQYYSRYLGFDDRGAFIAAFRDRERPLSEDRLVSLIERKAAYYQQAIRDHLTLFPGAVPLVRALASDLPLAIASGALRHEIEGILAAVNLASCFKVIVSAEDVTRGKPDPEIFLQALSRLNECCANAATPSECVVIEDSKEGVRGALAAGMKCLAVTNSHPPELLREATAIVSSLENVTRADLEALCA